MRYPTRVTIWFLKLVNCESKIFSDFFIMCEFGAEECVASKFVKVSDVRMAVEGGGSGVGLFDKL